MGQKRVSGPGPALGGWGTEAGARSQRGCPWRLRKLFRGQREKHLRLRVKQLICESLNGMRITETILAAAICSPGRGMQGRKSPGRCRAGSWSAGIVERFGVSSAVDCGGEARGDVREEVAVGHACAGHPGSRGGRAILQSHSQAVEPSRWPLCPHPSALDSGRPQRQAGLLLP